MFLSDPQWLLLQPLFPSSSRLKGTPGSLRGRPSLDNRLVLENIFLKLTSRIPWYDLPSTSPSWQTCYQRYHRWQHTGVWKSIIQELYADLHQRGGFDLHAFIETGELTLQREPCGRVTLTCPSLLKDTWQLSTAILIVNLLDSGRINKFW
jgi:transposase